MPVSELLYTTAIRDVYPVFAGERRSFVFTSFKWKKPTDGVTSTGTCLAHFSKLFIAVVALYSKRNSNVLRKIVPLRVLYIRLSVLWLHPPQSCYALWGRKMCIASLTLTASSASHPRKYRIPSFTLFLHYLVFLALPSVTGESSKCLPGLWIWTW